MKVLITGASGFIGRVAARLLLQQGIEIVTVGRRDPGLEAHHETVDLLAPGVVPALMDRTRPTHLLHAAWDVTPGQFWRSASNLDWAAATILLFRSFGECGGVRAVSAGTCAEYSWDHAKLREGDATEPVTFYGKIKHATQQVCSAAGEELGFGAAWGRIFWLYGPGEASGRLVADVTRSLLRGDCVETSDGRQTRDFLHVDDVAGALVAALTSDWTGPFNVGSGTATPVRTVIGHLAEMIGRPELVRFGARATPPGEPPELYADVSILNERIGFYPRHTLADGLRNMVDWSRDHL